MKKNPPWSREELILALDLYFRCNPSHTSQNHPEIVALSQLLNSLPISSDRPDAERFRNPNGVYMKLCNFLRLDPTYTGTGLARGGKLEEAVWKEFSGDRKRLRNAAEEIRASVAAKEAEEPDASLVSHSWRVLSPTVAIKTMDRSAFLHGGTGIPREVRPFFGMSDLDHAGEASQISLRHSGDLYKAHFSIDPTKTRLRLFWGDFAGVIKTKLTAFHEAFSRSPEPDGDGPEMRFSRNAQDAAAFDVSFILPGQLMEDIRGESEPEPGREEGGVKEYYGRRYERDPVNRRRALEIHGTKCCGCGFDFEEFYGPRGAGFIEVHHTKPLNTLQEKQTIDPAFDLVPVCSNCHRMIHRRKDHVLAVDELRALIGSR